MPRTQGVLRAGEPLVQFLEVHGVVHGVHARHVRDGRELLGHVTAHALGVGIRRHELGVCRLDLLELDEQLVERRIRDLGGVERVVAVRVVIEQVAKLRRARGRLGTGVRGLSRRLDRLGALDAPGLLRRHFAKQTPLVRHARLLSQKIQRIQGTITPLPPRVCAPTPTPQHMAGLRRAAEPLPGDMLGARPKDGLRSQPLLPGHSTGQGSPVVTFPGHAPSLENHRPPSAPPDFGAKNPESTCLTNQLRNNAPPSIPSEGRFVHGTDAPHLHWWTVECARRSTHTPIEREQKRGSP